MPLLICPLDLIVLFLAEKVTDYKPLKSTIRISLISLSKGINRINNLRLAQKRIRVK